MVLSSVAAQAATTSSWSRPSWAAVEPASGSKGVTTARKPSVRQSRYNLAPFAPESHNVALAVGQVFLMGDLGSRFDDNLGFQIDYTYGVSEIFGFAASLGRSGHDRALQKTGYSQWNLQTGLRTNLTWFDKAVPYAKVGFGFYRPSMGVTDESTVSSLLFGFHLGGGIDLQLSNEFFFGAGLTFHDIFGTTEQSANGPIELGGSYATFLVHAGMAF